MDEDLEKLVDELCLRYYYSYMILLCGLRFMKKFVDNKRLVLEEQNDE